MRPGRKSRLTREILAEVRRLRANGKPAASIAATLAGAGTIVVSASSVQNWLRGILPRSVTDEPLR